jgi:hypothetical protein
MRATIIVTAAFAVLSGCANPGDCLDGASDVTQGSGDAHSACCQLRSSRRGSVQGLRPRQMMTTPPSQQSRKSLVWSIR